MDIAPVNPGFMRCRGMKFPKSPVLNGRPRKLLRSGQYEQKEANAALRMVKSDDVVLELGGGIGFMSTLVATHRNAKAVHVFEANPRLVSYIRQVHEANNVTQATVHNALLSSEPGPPVPFYIRENFLASSMDRESDPDTITQVHDIEQCDINTVLSNIKPTVLICDIEGAEAHLLPAADFSDLRVAIVELHPQWIGQSGVQAVFDTFHRAGLTYFPKASEAKVVAFKKGW